MSEQEVSVMTQPMPKFDPAVDVPNPVPYEGKDTHEARIRDLENQLALVKASVVSHEDLIEKGALALEEAKKNPMIAGILRTMGL